ncbi:MAG: DNA-directed DNA polymerase [Methanobacteriaceae archaeon]|nr:DNA-directed DNA polymerase [Methanobacteriaceae archaeon]
MLVKRFILLDIDYITKQGKPIIRLFGKIPDENKSLIVLDKNFYPYFYVIPEDFDKCIDDLEQFKFLKIEKERKIDNLEFKDFLKVTIEHPREMLKLKKEIVKLKSVKDIREFDIALSLRYLIDKGLFPMSEVEVNGKLLKRPSSDKALIIELKNEPKQIKSGWHRFNILSFKIEAFSSEGLPEVSKDPIIMISFASNQGFQRILSTGKSSNDFTETVSTEMELLNKFVETIKSENPDIITGYNSDKFDFPYIKGRADKLNVSLDLGTDGSMLKFIGVPKKAAVVKGRVHVDLYRIVRRYIQLNSHTIHNVYLKLFGEDKIDISAPEIYNCWIDGGERREKLFRYSLEDVMAITKIGERILPMTIELSRIVGQPLFEIVRRGTGTQVKWYLIRKSYEFGLICPNEPGKFERNVVGGYVEEPLKGLHENIFYFDFRSLYPSIIIAKNISPETLSKEGDKDTCHVAPEFGYKFKREPKGFIPKVTSILLNERISIKSRLKESVDPEEKQILNFKQEAIKTLIATIYGLYNHPQYRWYCVEASEAITAWGRNYLIETMNEAEKYGFEVVYADTDGFFVTPLKGDTK